MENPSSLGSRTMLLAIQTTPAAKASGLNDPSMHAVEKLATDNNWQFNMAQVPGNPPYQKPVKPYDSTNPKWAIVTGTYQGLSFTSYVTQENYMRTDYILVNEYEGVVETRLERHYPNLYLDSQANETKFSASFNRIIDKTQFIALEGNYSQHFRLYAPIGHQTDALSLIDPSIMQTLIELSSNFDVELYDNILRLRTAAPLYTREVFQDALIALSAIVSHFRRTDQFWQATSTEPEPPQLKMSVSAGPVLKIGGSRIAAAVPLTGAVFGGMLLLFLISLPDNGTTLDTVGAFIVLVIAIVWLSIASQRRSGK
jgi:hypothetical protein